MTENVLENRNVRLLVAWTVEFQRLKRRERIPLILLIGILISEVVRWLI